MSSRFDNRPGVRWRRRLFVVALTLATAAFACGDPEDDDPDQFIGNDTGDEADADAGTVDDAGSDTGEDADTGFDAGQDADGGDNGDDEDDFGPCGRLVELGELDEGEQTVTVDFDEDVNDVDDVTTGCEGADEDRSVMLDFEVSTKAWLEVEADDDIALQLRFGNCLQSSDRVACDETGVAASTALGAPEAYVVVDPLDGAELETAEVTLRLEKRELCDEETEHECLGDGTAGICRTSYISVDLPHWVEGQCPAGCQDGVCRGDSCADPLEVQPGESLTFDNMALTKQHVEYDDTCIPEGNTWWSGYAREAVIEVPGLESGDELSVEIEGEETGYQTEDIEESEVHFFLKSECSDEASCLDLERLGDELVHEVTASGSHYVFIDSTTEWLDAEYEVSIDIIE